MSAKVLSRIIYAVIIVSIVFQLINTLWPSLILGLVGIGLATLIVPLSIWKDRRSAIEEQQRFEEERLKREAEVQSVYAQTREGRTLGNLRQWQ